MQYPEESLEDYTVKPAPEAAAPPREVLLRFTGEVEVLKPLAGLERKAIADQAAIELLPEVAPHRFSWFHRSIAVGGAFAMIALILASAVIIGINEPLAGTGEMFSDSGGEPIDVAIDRWPADMPARDEHFNFDIFSTASSPRRYFRSTRRRAARPHVQLAAYKPRRQTPRPQLTVAQFIPTTLVIYVENGEIKSRIERWLIPGF